MPYMKALQAWAGPWAAARLAWWFAILVALLGFYFATRSATLDVRLEMASSAGRNGQVFANVVGQYREADSSRFAIVDDGRSRTYQLRLKEKRIPKSVRIDPGNRPGRVDVRSLKLESAYGMQRFTGRELNALIASRNALDLRDAVEGVQLRSVGDDPWFDFPVPKSWRRADSRQRSIAAAGMLAGCALLAWLGWRSRSTGPKLLRASLNTPGVFAMVAAGSGVVLILGMAEVGCATPMCSVRGLQSGLSILLGGLAFATVGAATLGSLARRNPVRLFLWIAVGQVALVIYIYLRSLVTVWAPWLPLTHPELALLVVASVVVLLHRRIWQHGELATTEGRAWLLLQLGLLAGVALIVADRDLPRVVMLSTDPDIHAYLANFLVRMGSIPWSGESVFGYPAGSAALGYAWGALGALDVRDAITMLPLFATFVAALVIGEAAATHSQRNGTRLLLMLTAVALTAGAFMLPLFIRFSHMEGTARQFSVVFSATVLALLHAHLVDRTASRLRLAAALLCTLFVLAVLNPASVVVPSAIVAGSILHMALQRQRYGWLVAALFLVPLALLLDPYYYALMWPDSTPIAKSVATDRFTELPTSKILSGVAAYWVERPLGLLQTGWSMARGQRWPLFAGLLVALAAAAHLSGVRLRRDATIWLPILLAIVLLSMLEAFSTATRTDSRFYLLAPYLAFSMTQQKMLLLTAATVAVVMAACTNRERLWSWRASAITVAFVLLATLTMRWQEPLQLQPRYGYCGPSGCPTIDDIAVLEGIRSLQSQGRLSATVRNRILLPNSLRPGTTEYWIFPTTASRALPFFNGPDSAFFYYQGDRDYTTDNYLRHVCKRFDRNWLASQGIGYVFLPSDRGDACLHGMDLLVQTEQVVLNSGNAYLLRLR